MSQSSNCLATVNCLDEGDGKLVSSFSLVHRYFLPSSQRSLSRLFQRYDGDRAAIFVLEEGEYVESGESVALPPLTSGVLTRFVEERASLGSTDWLRRVREWARGNFADG